MIPGALAGARTLAIDSAPLIYLVERHATFGPPMEVIAAVVDAGELRLVASTLTLTEVLTQPLRLARGDIAGAYERILRHHPAVRLVALDATIAASAADFRARYNLRTPDAIQVATAVAAGADVFLTNDRDLGRIAEIRVVQVGALVTT